MGGRGASSAIGRTTVFQADHYYDAHFKPKGLEKYDPNYLWGEAVEFTANLLGVSKEEAREYNSAVNAFTDRAYKRIRQYQRGEEIEDWAQGNTAERERLLEGYISAAPKWGGGQTFRGVGSHYGMVDAGDVIDMGGTSSWSTDIGTAVSLGKTSSHMLTVFVCDTQRKGTSTRHLSKHPSEDEVTVSKSARYEVVSITEKYYNGISYEEIKVKEV